MRTTTLSFALSALVLCTTSRASAADATAPEPAASSSPRVLHLDPGWVHRFGVAGVDLHGVDLYGGVSVASEPVELIVGLAFFEGQSLHGLWATHPRAFARVEGASDLLRLGVGAELGALFMSRASRTFDLGNGKTYFATATLGANVSASLDVLSGERWALYVGGRAGLTIPLALTQGMTWPLSGEVGALLGVRLPL